MYDLLLITGPTASGKTRLAATVAAGLDGEVISADSRQVYRRLTIGTGKDYDDFLVKGKRVPCHLIDIVDPGYKYSVFEFQHDFLEVYNDIKERKKFPIVCGGSGLYAESVIKGYKLLKVPADAAFRAELESKSMDELAHILSSYKKLHNTTDIDTRGRVIRAIEIERYYFEHQNEYTGFPQLRSLVVGVKFDRDSRRKRITQRLNQRLENGMIEEVKQLLAGGIDSEILIYYGLEYKYITLYLKGKLSYPEMYSALESSIHQYSKRQMTWFRGMEKRGVEIHWLDGLMPLEEKVEKITGWLEELR